MDISATNILVVFTSYFDFVQCERRIKKILSRKSGGEIGVFWILNNRKYE